MAHLTSKLSHYTDRFTDFEGHVAVEDDWQEEIRRNSHVPEKTGIMGKVSKTLKI